MKHWQAQLDIRKPTYKIGTRLFGFLLASITLHIFLLLSYGAQGESASVLMQSLRITLISAPQTDRTAALQDVKTPPAKSAHKPAPEFKQKTVSDDKTTDTDIKPTSKKDISSKSETVVVNPVEPRHEVPVPHNNMASSANVAEAQNAQHVIQQRAAIRTLLRQELKKHYHYPFLARRRGWHGAVLLGFTLDERGSIINARVTKSSGHRTLDSAALKSLKRVAGIELQPTEALDFELPVIYNLYGG